MSQTVIGIFDYTSEAQEAVGYLVNNGFSRSDIDLSSRADAGSHADAGNHADTANTTDDDDDSIGGFFSNLFGSSDDADKYTEVGRKGSIVTVHAKTDQEAENAAKILDNYGAIDVNERSAQYRNTANTTGKNTKDGDSIKIIEEKLEVGKREVEAGGLRLRSRIVQQAVNEDVRLRTERVRVERSDVNRAATDADLAGFKDSTIEMVEHKEVPVVSKKAFVTGEVSLEKEVEENTETVQDTVRKTEVDTENFTDKDTKSASGDIKTTDEKGGFYK